MIRGRGWFQSEGNAHPIFWWYPPVLCPALHTEGERKQSPESCESFPWIDLPWVPRRHPVMVTKYRVKILVFLYRNILPVRADPMGRCRVAPINTCMLGAYRSVMFCLIEVFLTISWWRPIYLIPLMNKFNKAMELESQKCSFSKLSQLRCT